MNHLGERTKAKQAYPTAFACPHRGQDGFCFGYGVNCRDVPHGRDLCLEAIEKAKLTWKIRYEGTPTNPRFKSPRRRTALLSGTEAEARAYADSLENGQHVKIIWIRRAMK